MKFLSKLKVSLLNLSFLIVQRDSAVQRASVILARVGAMLLREGGLEVALLSLLDKKQT